MRAPHSLAEIGAAPPPASLCAPAVLELRGGLVAGGAISNPLLTRSCSCLLRMNLDAILQAPNDHRDCR